MRAISPSAYLYCSDSLNRLYSWSQMTRDSASSSRREYFGNDRIAVMKTGAVRHTRTSYTQARTHARTRVRTRGKQVKRALAYGRLRT